MAGQFRSNQFEATVNRVEIFTESIARTIINGEPYIYLAEFTTTTFGLVTLDDYDVYLGLTSIEYTIKHSEGQIIINFLLEDQDAGDQSFEIIVVPIG